MTIPEDPLFRAKLSSGEGWPPPAVARKGNSRSSDPDHRFGVGGELPRNRIVPLLDQQLIVVPESPLVAALETFSVRFCRGVQHHGTFGHRFPFGIVDILAEPRLPLPEQDQVRGDPVAEPAQTMRL